MEAENPTARRNEPGPCGKRLNSSTGLPRPVIWVRRLTATSLRDRCCVCAAHWPAEAGREKEGQERAVGRGRSAEGQCCEGGVMAAGGVPPRFPPQLAATDAGSGMYLREPADRPTSAAGQLLPIQKG